MLLILSVAAALLSSIARASAADPPLAPSTIVVFNSSIPESAELARFYAQKRGSRATISWDSRVRETRKLRGRISIARLRRRSGNVPAAEVVDGARVA
jgi:hypothetical protein